MTQINSMRALAWLVLAILAASLPTALVAQVVVRGEDATVNVNVGQSSGSPEWGFVYWSDSAKGRCWASSRLWRLWSDRSETEIYLRLDRLLRDRGSEDRDWQLANPPGATLIDHSNADWSNRRGYFYRAVLTSGGSDGEHVTYTQGALRRSVQTGSGYWLHVGEERPPASQARQAALPYRDTEVYMGQTFVEMVDDTDRSDYKLGFYARSRDPRPALPDQWGDWWPVRSMVLELPTAGLRRAIRATGACAADLPR